MMTWLFGHLETHLSALVRTLWNAATRTASAIWEVLKTGWAWAVAIVLGLVSITNHVIDFVWTQVMSLAALVGHLVLRDSSEVNAAVTATADQLAVINRFVPLAESFTLIGALSLVMLAGWIYRLIKSWIPTVS